MALLEPRASPELLAPLALLASLAQPEPRVLLVLMEPRVLLA